jgi:hypothetical protein
MYPRSWPDHRVRLAIALAIFCTFAGCAANMPGPSQPATGGDVKIQIDSVFGRLEAGQLSPPPAGSVSAPSSGWEAKLPDGTMVVRSTLQDEARPLIALGADAVPGLLPWVQHANAALRYTATFALEQITGEHVQLAVFDDADRDGRARAIAVWQRWYDTHRAPR